MPGISRCSDWPERLNAVIEAARHRPFAWGAHDCALFAADAIRAMTGIDPAHDWRGRYHGMRAAVRLKRRSGCTDWLHLFRTQAARWGLPDIAPDRAQRGDVVALALPNDPVIGICVGARIAAPGWHGLLFLSRDPALDAWHIPFLGES